MVWFLSLERYAVILSLCLRRFRRTTNFAHRADDEGEQRAAEQSEQDDALLPSRIELVPLP
jgi:hypothetical protein